MPASHTHDDATNDGVGLLFATRRQRHQKFIRATPHVPAGTLYSAKKPFLAIRRGAIVALASVSENEIEIAEPGQYGPPRPTSRALDPAVGAGFYGKL